MFKIVFLSMTLVLSSANAQLGQQMLNQVKKINEQKKSQIPLGSMVAGCTDCLEKPNINKQCWAEMCDAKNLKNYLEFEAEAGKNATVPVPNEQKIRAYIVKSEQVLNMDQFLEGLRSAAEKWDGTVPQTSNLGFAMNELMSWFEGVTPEFKFEGYKVVLDKEKLKAKKPGLSDLQLGLMGEYYDYMYSGVASSMDADLSPRIRLKKKYPGKSFEDAVSIEIAEIKRVEKLNVYEGVNWSSTDEIIADIESGEDVSEDAVAELLDAAVGSKMMADYNNPESTIGKILGKVPSDGWKAKLKDPSIKSRLLEELGKSQTEDKREDQLRGERLADLCVAQVRANYAKLPSVDQIKQTKTNIEAVKVKIKAKLLSKYSEHSQKKLKTVLDDIEFSLPPDKDSYLRNLDNKLKRAERKQEKLIAQFTKTLKPEAMIPGFVLGLLSQSKTEEAVEAVQVPGSCVTNHQALSDSALSLSGAILVSYTSVNSPAMGEGVIAHEIGHVIDANLRTSLGSSVESAQKQVDTRKCLNDRHAPLTTDYSGEDFSDYVSGLVTSGNMSCLFPEGTWSSEEKPLLNKRIDDPHSSEYFRALHIEQTQNGALTPACNKMLVERSSPADFGSCLK